MREDSTSWRENQVPFISLYNSGINKVLLFFLDVDVL